MLLVSVSQEFSELSWAGQFLLGVSHTVAVTCWLGLQTSENLTALEDPLAQPMNQCWLLAGVLHVGHSAELPDNLRGHLGNYDAFYDSLRNGTPSLPLYAIDHSEPALIQCRRRLHKSMDASKYGPLGTTLEAGYHRDIHQGFKS